MPFVSGSTGTHRHLHQSDEGSFSAKLNSFEGKPIASGKDFEAETGRLDSRPTARSSSLAQDARSSC